MLFLRPRRFRTSLHGRGCWRVQPSLAGEVFSSRQMAQSSGVLVKGHFFPLFRSVDQLVLYLFSRHNLTRLGRKRLRGAAAAFPPGPVFRVVEDCVLNPGLKETALFFGLAGGRPVPLNIAGRRQRSSGCTDEQPLGHMLRAHSSANDPKQN
jgi:hypothetical protein